MGNNNAYTDKRPRYQELMDELRARIVGGELEPGVRLPSFAAMKAQAGVSQTTVEHVYSRLEQEGLVERRRGSGIFVATRRRPVRTSAIAVGFGMTTVEGAYYWLHLLVGVQRAALRLGLHNIVPVSSDTLPLERVDGILLHGMQSPRPARPPLIPVVTIMGDEPDMPCVVPDDASGMQQAVEHLVELGHSHIGLMTWLEQLDLEPRRRGYYHGLAAAGIQARGDWVWPIRFLGMPSQYHYGYHNMELWLNSGFMETGCTAVLAHNDQHALGVVKALQDAGLKVPGDISVVGFDGTEDAQMMSPSLTSVTVPLEAIAEAGVDLLARQIREEVVPDAKLVFPVGLRLGESTAPPRQ